LKTALLACIVLAAAGAGSWAQSLPVPPVPPAHPPTTDAPMPNFDTAIPAEPGRSLVTLDTGINHRQAPTPGLGYAPGANYQLDNDRRTFVLPGIMMHVPLP
jgi:hypothetical protein